MLKKLLKLHNGIYLNNFAHNTPSIRCYQEKASPKHFHFRDIWYHSTNILLRKTYEMSSWNSWVELFLLIIHGNFRKKTKQNCFQVARFTPKGGCRGGGIILHSLLWGRVLTRSSYEVSKVEFPAEGNWDFHFPSSLFWKPHCCPWPSALHSVTLQPDRRCSFHQTFHKAHAMRAWGQQSRLSSFLGNYYLIFMKPLLPPSPSWAHTVRGPTTCACAWQAGKQLYVSICSAILTGSALRRVENCRTSALSVASIQDAFKRNTGTSPQLREQAACTRSDRHQIPLFAGHKNPHCCMSFWCVTSLWHWFRKKKFPLWHDEGGKNPLRMKRWLKTMCFE